MAKNGNLNWLWIAGGLLGVYYISQLSVGLSNVQFNVEDVEIKSLSDILVTMNIQNVSGATATVNSLTGNILLNGNQLAAISDFKSVLVPGNGQVNLPIDVNLSIFGLPQVVQNLFAGGGNQLNFSVVGAANVDGVVIPFNQTKTIQT
jgi:LEA14-like dessication related protein